VARRCRGKATDSAIFLAASKLAAKKIKIKDMKLPIESQNCIPAVAAAASSHMSAEACDWEFTGDEGMWVKRLYEDEARGERTWLFRMDAGACSPPHSHEAFEQVFVLEGSFSDGDRRISAGEFCARAPGAVHSATSEGGALMLVVYTKA
jgi:anti-sigma factor ChrR (cupin superfamily)